MNHTNEQPTIKQLMEELAQHIDGIAKILHKWGKRDAAKSVKPYGREVFPQIIMKACNVPPDLDTLGDVWYADYMSGYEEGRA